MIADPARSRLGSVLIVVGFVVSLLSALAMRDRVRLVDIVTLFFGGVGTGAGIAHFVRARADLRAVASRARAD